MSISESAIVGDYLIASWYRYAQVAATVLIVWDYFLMFGGEVKYYWSRQWTRAKVLFCMIHYFPIAVTIFNTSVILDPEVTDKVSYGWCLIFSPIVGILEIYIIQAILITRLYAVYGGSQLVIYGLLVLYMLGIVVGVIITVFATLPVKVTAHPAPGLNICTLASQSGYLWTFWIPVLLFEGVAYFLLARRTWNHVYRSPFRGQTHTKKVLAVMFRDSSVYFLFILMAYTVNALFFATAPPPLQRIIEGPIFSVVSILGSRMMINVRATNSEPLPTMEVLDVHTWAVGMHAQSEDVE